ncbi:hypothetical protein [Microbacterium sp. YY-01]|uniref:hypothetical protein n=1 Tax=Microbacterium sp. YY-01 TaxID=3421634 RepID=UPI003D186D30
MNKSSVVRMDCKKFPLSRWLLGVTAIAITILAIWGISSWALKQGNRVEVLQASLAPWPEEFSIGMGTETRYDDFYSIMVGTSTVADPSADEDHCLIVVIETPARGSCAPELIDAVVTFTVTPSSPSALREKFPDGATLSIRFDGNEVTVSHDIK